MNKKQWYETLFENYGEKYDNECFAQGTIGECDFIEKEINHNKALKVIDIGCGTGRHSIELSKRGYSMTGIDLSESLLEKAKFIFTTLNGLFPIFNSIEEFCASNTDDGNATYHNNTFDLMTFRDYNITKVEDDNGAEKELECNERYYIPSEITWLLKTLGFTKIEIFGATLGAFSREDKLKTADFEMLVIAER